MTRLQHESLGTLLQTNNEQTFVITTAGEITARDNIENYDLTAASNQITVNAAETGVNIDANDTNADTIIIGTNTVTGQYQTNSTDTLSVLAGANIQQP